MRPGCSGAPSSTPAAGPNAASTSGANASTSGHITMTSRGSSVASSASRPTITSRRTSTWRDRPWQAWTWTDRSLGVASCFGPVARSSAIRSWSAPSDVSGRGDDGRIAISGSSRRTRLASSVASPAIEASNGCVAGVGTSDPSGGSARGQPSPERERRLRQPQVDLAMLREGVEHPQVALGERGGTEDREPRRQVDDRRVGSAAAPPPPRAAPPATARRRRRGPPATGAAARGDRRAGGRRGRPRRARPPRRAASPGAARRTCRTGGRPAGPAGTGGRGAPRPGRRRDSGSPCGASPRRAARRSPPGRATRARSGLHGSSSAVVASASPTSRCGDGNSTFAQMPSAPRPVPSRWESRCATQRSTPRVGTATTSGANGSAGTVARTSANASTRTSVRSATCTRRPEAVDVDAAWVTLGTLATTPRRAEVAPLVVDHVALSGSGHRAGTPLLGDDGSRGPLLGDRELVGRSSTTGLVGRSSTATGAVVRSSVTTSGSMRSAALSRSSSSDRAPLASAVRA